MSEKATGEYRLKGPGNTAVIPAKRSASRNPDSILRVRGNESQRQDAAATVEAASSRLRFPPHAFAGMMLCSAHVAGKPSF